MSVELTTYNKGTKLYQTNKTLRDISTVMEHPEMKAFFDKYLADPLSCYSMLLLMKIYQNIPSDNPYEKIATLYETMSNESSRVLFHQSYINWLGSSTSSTKLIE
jgi:hypothetical protein